MLAKQALTIATMDFKRLFTLAVVLISCSDHAVSFLPIQQTRFVHSTSFWHRPSHQPSTLRRYSNEDWEDDEDDYIDLQVSDSDWRAFRAKLVQSEHQYLAPDVQDVRFYEEEECDISSGNCDVDGIGYYPSPPSERRFLEPTPMMHHHQVQPPVTPSQWAFESGKVIEKGALILGGVEQEFGFGLRQQYFHKAAILVLDHDESTFTKGIILNRPTDLLLEDDINPGVHWRVWFGGDVQGLNSENPDLICIHSLTDERATRASVPVMGDIQWTSFENAKKLVHSGVARPEDFWVFSGYAGWGPGQLSHELDTRAWHMVSTDPGTLLQELNRQSSYADPREAGLETWHLLMNMIGRGDDADDSAGDFDDCMLKEWALKNLLSSRQGGGAGDQLRSPKGSSAQMTTRRWGNYVQQQPSEQVTVGSLIRAAPVDRSPFLLEEQELHKSVILILSDDENVSVGAILNRPSAKGLDVQLNQRHGSRANTVTLPLRFGGQYSIKGSDPVVWLHCNHILRSAGIGRPMGPNYDGVWQCEADEVSAAISQGLARPEDFFVVTGVTVWQKGEGKSGIQGEVASGKFEVIPDYRTQDVWNALSRQEVLDKMNLMRNLQAANEAWHIGGKNANSLRSHAHMASLQGFGIGRTTYEHDDKYVFRSNVPVSKLSDDALRSWVATFLLGAPTLGV